MDVRDAIDRINDDIVEIISHFVELKQKGRNHTGCCPFHDEKTPSFVVSEPKGMYKCFGCGKGGDAINFIQEHEGVEFKEAVTIGAKKLNLDFAWKEQKDFSDKEYQHKESLRIACAKAASFFSENLKTNAEAKRYYEQRGFKIDPEDPFQPGYAPSGNKLLSWAGENEINKQLLVEAGLVGYNEQQSQHYDFFRDRIIFPLCDKTGKVIGFTGRALHDGKGVAKYMNSPDSPVFVKGNELFALNIARRAIRAENRAYLVEGQFDVLRLHKLGVTNTIAPSGTAFTSGQAKLLKAHTKNVTLIYDGDNAGRKAIDRNAQILVKEQFNVMVILLPEEQDPDSFFDSYEKFEEYKDENQQDYILYKVESGIKRCQNPAYKSEFIKEVSTLITCYDDPSLHEVYMETVGAIIKPKKAWADAVKTIVADKAPVEKKVYIPKNVSADEFLERGFYAENNCYYFADSKGHPHQRSNCMLTPLFHIESTINAKRLYEVRNVNNVTKVIEIPQKDLVSLSAFQIRIESLGNFWWDGSQSDLNRLKRWLYEKTETCKEISQLGWQEDGFFAWGNGIYNDEFIPVDSYGIVKHGKKSYYIPAFSSIYKEERNLYQFERKFIHMEGNITLREYAKKMVSVFGDNAKVALSFYFASLFRDIIVSKSVKFPILNMFGPKGAGKTACADSLCRFFGLVPDPPNVHNTTKAALADHIASSVNAICHIDEYRNDIEMEKREFLKGIWDGSGRSRMNMDKDKKKETTPVQQSLILTGQQMATADIALFSRFVFLSFTQTEFSDEEYNAFKELKEIERRGITHITHQILRLRPIFRDNLTNGMRQTSERMKAAMNGAIVEDRIFNNWLVPLSAFYILSDHLELPWDIDDFFRTSVKLMLAQNSETKKNDDLGNFWKVVEYLISSNVLFEGGDYKLTTTNQFQRRFYEDGKWKREDIHWKEPKQLFYLTKNRVFSLYKTQCLREGDKPLPESTVEYYLKNSKAFICDQKKENFKKYDAKMGVQMMSKDGTPMRTSTSAMVFDMDKLPFAIEYSEEEAAMPAPQPPSSPKPDATQQGVPF
jgi:DNA primase catalytic core